MTVLTFHFLLDYSTASSKNQARAVLLKAGNGHKLGKALRAPRFSSILLLLSAFSMNDLPQIT